MLSRNEHTRLLLESSKLGDEDRILQLLQEDDIAVNADDELMMTPLHYAVIHQQPEVVRALLRNPFISMNELNNERKAALHLAAQYPNKEITDALLNAFQQNTQNSSFIWNSLYRISIENDNVYMIEELCKRGIVDVTKLKGIIHPVYQAAKAGKSE